MSKKFCLFLFLISACLNAHAMSLSECIDHTLALMDKHAADRSLCMALNVKNAKAMPQCLVRATSEKAENACFPAMKASAKIQNFLWQQQVITIENYERGLISGKQMLEQYENNLRLIQEEEQEGSRMQIAEYQRIRNAEAKRIENDRIDRAISILGGVVQRKNQNRGYRTYILNGRVINCFDHGDITNCN